MAILAFAEGDLPDWFRRVRPADSEAQREGGIQLWVTCDVGEVAVRLMSPSDPAPEDAQPSIATVRTSADMPSAEIRRRIVAQVARVRATMRWWPPVAAEAKKAA